MNFFKKTGGITTARHHITDFTEKKEPIFLILLSAQMMWFTHTAPYGRMLIRYALPAPMACSM